MNGGFQQATGSFSDTGQWKLIVSIRPDGLSALLKNTLNAETKPVVAVDKIWEPDSSSLLGNIESAIFDNPGLLDDFATQIVITTPQNLWIPIENTEDEEFDPKYFTEFFNVAEEDISAEFCDDEVALFSLVPGLNSFLQRTLPGCKVSSSISVLKNIFQKKAIGDSIFVSIPDSGNSEGFADIFAFGNGRFLSGSSQPFKDISDIAYRVLLLCRSYRLKPENVNVTVFSSPDDGHSLAGFLEPFVSAISFNPLPELSVNYGVPLAPALLVS